ncbi:7B2, partial [Biomphalaria glabrata]
KMPVLFFIPLLLHAVLASYHPWVEDLKGAQMVDPFEELFPQGSVLDSTDGYPFWRDENDNDLVSVYDDSLINEAHLRDEEHMENSDLHGFQSVSGGTAEGAPNAKQVKSDKQLPAYCNPPNPCPLGKIGSQDNCVDNFVNSAENNQKLLSEQDCPCDTEHMFTCPAGSQTVSSKGSSGSQQMALNKVIDELSKMEHNGESLENNPDLSATRKRLTVVAKKSPHLIKKRSEVSDHGNPYLQGERMEIAAKKDPTMAKNSMHNWRLKQH